MQKIIEMLTIVALGVLMALTVVLILTPADVPEATSVGTVVVQAGDTLWSLASKYYPNSHTGEMVYKIRQLNPGVDPGRLAVGMRLEMP